MAKRENLLEKYQEVLDEAFEAFSQDPSYAIAIAKQAGSLISQQELRAERALTDSDSLD